MDRLLGAAADRVLVHFCSPSLVGVFFVGAIVGAAILAAVVVGLELFASTPGGQPPAELINITVVVHAQSSGDLFWSTFKHGAEMASQGRAVRGGGTRILLVRSKDHARAPHCPRRSSTTKWSATMLQMHPRPSWMRALPDRGRS